ncbi:hypothetical protein [Thermobrachium celere]|uniref:hypothetical protein n=1 Tax=Thermobrachium celere TaxID=53422 RepID=UPI0019420878|nr:hypothetical protein [Thermobrachium celere]GFR34445.1 hypothetical protein TCEA9_02570 [Thermobrachium celere]
MGKLSTHEKFFIGRILYGIEHTGNSVDKSLVETLLSQRLDIEEEFKTLVKNALIFSYCDDVEKFKKKIITIDPKSMWDESFKKLYKGRETVLRDVVLEWYSSYFDNKEKNILGFIKKFFKR